MVGMIFKPQNKSFRHFLSFRNKLTLLPLKTYVLMDAKVQHEDSKKGLHDVRSFIGACNFYRRHIKNFTYTSAILTELIKKSTTWRWGPQEQQAFDELKDKVANAKCLGLPRGQGEIILVTDVSNVGSGGTLFQWQALEKEEFNSAISQWGTEGLNRDGTLKHSYPDDKWVLVPLGHCNWKWNQARGNYSTYEQELLAGMLLLSSQARLLGSNPVVWLCDQEPVRTFQKGPPPEKAKLRRLVDLPQSTTADGTPYPGSEERVCRLHQPQQLGRPDWCPV